MRQDLYGTDPTFIHFHFHSTMMGTRATGNSNLDSLLISSVSYLDSLFWERLPFGLIVFSNRGLHRDTLRHALLPLNVLNTPFGFLENQRIYFTLQSSSFICILYTKRYRQNSSDTPWIWFAWDCLLFCHGINHHLVGTFFGRFPNFLQANPRYWYVEVWTEPNRPAILIQKDLFLKGSPLPALPHIVAVPDSSNSKGPRVFLSTLVEGWLGSGNPPNMTQRTSS